MTRLPGQYLVPILLVGLLAADQKQEECPDCFPSGYLIDMSGLPISTDPPPAVLFSGYRNGQCRNDLVCTGSPDAYFGDIGGTTFNWWTSCPPQDREMVAFAGGQAPTVLKPSANSTGIVPTLATPRQLSIAAWISPAVTVSQPVMVDEFRRTQQIFDDHGAGITLNYTLKPFPTPLPAGFTGINSDASCDLYTPLQGVVTSGGNPVTVMDPSRLNVYFVSRLRYSNDGLICFDPGNVTTKPYIIFVDAELQHAPSTLAHELGHALGMLISAAMPGGTKSMYPGDVNELDLDPYLATDNLMTSGVMHVGHIALGQIYRMHFDERSWLWRGKTPAGGYPRSCQAGPVDGGPCPPLTLHPPRGWP